MKTELFITLLGEEIVKIDNLTRAEFFFADGVELRLDTLESFSMQKLQGCFQEARLHHLKVLITLRPQRQGGMFAGSEEERLKKIEEMCALQPDLVDLEYDVPLAFKEKLSIAFPKILWISSYHDFEKTPHDLERVLDSMLCPYTHIYKIATMTHSALDALRILSFVRKTKKQHHIIGIGMGEHGKITRILAPVYGNYLSFAAVKPFQNASLGQLSFEELKKIYHYPSLNQHTKVYALIGGKVSHSKGPLVHNAVFAHFQINACYVAISVTEGELQTFLKEIPHLSFKGLSVTMPLKELIISYLDALDSTAQEIKRVNTVVIEGERLIGSNTDSYGALNAIEKHLPVRGKKIVLVGAGGAGGAIASSLREKGAVVFILSRTKESAMQLSSLLGCQGGGLDELPRLFREGYDLLINATPSGDLAINPQWILPKTYVMDIVTTPKETPFLMHAKEKGCHLIFGEEMFQEQAILQQRIWSSGALLREEVRKVITSSI